MGLRGTLVRPAPPNRKVTDGGGIVIYMAERVLSFGENMFALPLDILVIQRQLV